MLKAFRHKLGSHILTPTQKADSSKHLMLQHGCLSCPQTGRIGAEQHMQQLVPFINDNLRCYREPSTEPSHTNMCCKHCMFHRKLSAVSSANIPCKPAATGPFHSMLPLSIPARISALIFAHTKHNALLANSR